MADRFDALLNVHQSVVALKQLSRGEDDDDDDDER